MAYTPINFRNKESGGTPLSANNLNHMEAGITSAHNSIESIASDVAGLTERYGTPLVAHTASEMTDQNKIYVYVGSESGYTNGHWYYYNGSAWADGGVYQSNGINTDTSLTQANMAADAKKVGDEISELKSEISSSGGFNDRVKQALIAFANAVAFKNASIGATVMQNLNSAFYEKEVLSISASFAQNDNIIYTHDSLDDLKQYLTVTAYYDDATSSVVTAYTLSGELTEGASTITVAYNGKTTTFTVNVTAGVPTDAYTMYDYIYRTGTSGSTVAAVGGLINLNSYDNLDELSYDITFSVLTGYTKDTALFGARMDNSSATGVSVYLGTTSSTAPEVGVSDRLTVVARNAVARSGAPMNVNGINKLIYTNSSSSPSRISLNGVESELTWGNTLYTVTRPVTILSNPTPTATSMTVQRYMQIGNFRFYNLNGNLVGNYYPVVRKTDNVIGMYDTVSESFYTASTVNYATIGNSSCIYGVGTWE